MRLSVICFLFSVKGKIKVKGLLSRDRKQKTENCFIIIPLRRVVVGRVLRTEAPS